MSGTIARRAVVRGRVQGVYFRDSTRRAAREAGVTGRADNADDGSVVVHLEGPTEAVGQVLAFLRLGPPRAEVSDVEVAEVDPEGLTDFRIG